MQTDSQKIIFIDLIHYPLLVLGPDKRVGVWFDGCSFGCEDCISIHTWEQKESSKTTISSLMTKIEKFDTKKITISGGEPFEQPRALLEFLQELKKRDFDDILIYSGFKFNYLKKNFIEIIDLVDVVIDGQFDKDKISQESFRGSKNQNIYILNDKLKSTYQEFQTTQKRNLQILEKNDEVYLLGIPKIEDREIILN